MKLLSAIVFAVGSYIGGWRPAAAAFLGASAACLLCVNAIRRTMKQHASLCPGPKYAHVHRELQTDQQGRTESEEAA